MKSKQNILVAVVMIIGFSNLVSANTGYTKLKGIDPQSVSQPKAPCPYAAVSSSPILKNNSGISNSGGNESLQHLK